MYWCSFVLFLNNCISTTFWVSFIFYLSLSQVCCCVQLWKPPVELFLQPLPGLRHTSRQPSRGVWGPLSQCFCKSVTCSDAHNYTSMHACLHTCTYAHTTHTHTHTHACTRIHKRVHVTHAHAHTWLLNIVQVYYSNKIHVNIINIMAEIGCFFPLSFKLFSTNWKLRDQISFQSSFVSVLSFSCMKQVSSLKICTGFCCKIQFTSVQDGIYVLGKAHIYPPPHLSEVSPMLALKQFQCLSEWWWRSLVLSRKIF